MNHFDEWRQKLLSTPEPKSERAKFYWNMNLIIALGLIDKAEKEAHLLDLREREVAALEKLAAQPPEHPPAESEPASE